MKAKELFESYVEMRRSEEEDAEKCLQRGNLADESTYADRQRHEKLEGFLDAHHLSVKYKERWKDEIRNMKRDNSGWAPVPACDGAA